eukprot:741845-Pyramimonas_sp.AAC.1
MAAPVVRARCQRDNGNARHAHAALECCPNRAGLLKSPPRSVRNCGPRLFVLRALHDAVTYCSKTRPRPTLPQLRTTAASASPGARADFKGPRLP